MEKRIGKRDLILLAVLLAVILAVLGAARLTRRKDGAQVVVTVDGETYGVYDLHAADQTVEITVDGAVSNILEIRDGAADMTWADCPDKLCVRQRAVAAAGETIVCLPHKVVVEVTGGSDEVDFDAVAQ